ncbi:MAG: response regulator [Elusimicrobiota bacterium]|nr:MAG: response regulator [Elusimicrobiota bacterium]
MTVLLVDDDKSSLTLLRLHLVRDGCDVSATLDPREGLRLLQERSYDCLVVDGQMGPIDGFALAGLAKELHPDIRVAMVSGVYERDDIAGSAVDRLFQKPVDPDALARYVRMI